MKPIIFISAESLNVDNKPDPFTSTFTFYSVGWYKIDEKL